MSDDDQGRPCLKIDVRSISLLHRSGKEVQYVIDGVLFRTECKSEENAISNFNTIASAMDNFKL